MGWWKCQYQKRTSLSVVISNALHMKALRSKNSQNINNWIYNWLLCFRSLTVVVVAVTIFLNFFNTFWVFANAAADGRMLEITDTLLISFRLQNLSRMRCLRWWINSFPWTQICTRKKKEKTYLLKCTSYIYKTTMVYNLKTILFLLISFAQVNYPHIYIISSPYV